MPSLVCPSCQSRIVIERRPADGRVECDGCGKSLRLKPGRSGQTPERPDTNRRTARPPATGPAKARSKRPTKTARFVPAKKAGGSKAAADEISEFDELLAADEAAAAELPETFGRPGGRLAAGDREKVLTVDQVLDAFEGAIEKPRVTFGYRLAIAFVGLVMPILPLVYVAITCASIYATYWFATNFWYLLLLSRRPRVMIVGFCVYFGVLMAGVIVSFFLLKPFLARRPKTELGDGIDRKKQPTLYAFADRVADIVGAPRAGVIRGTFEPNASAGYNGGFLGLFGGRFALTVGLPLLDGMSLPSVAGIMAHEFGHFSQSGGRFFSGLIRRINLWLLRVAYERDDWDLWLDDLTNSESLFWQAVGFFGYVGVGLSRLVLKLIAWIGMAVSGSLAKQMEFHADAFESALVGAETFDKSCRRLCELQVAYHVAGEHLLTGRDATYLPSDYFRFVTLLADELPKGAKKRAIRLYKEEKESFADSHPSIPRRVDRVQSREERGVFHLNTSARGLVDDFGSLRRDLTDVIYLIHFGETGDDTRRSPREALNALKSLT